MIVAQTTPDVDVYEWVTGNRTEPWIALSHVITVFGNTLTLTIMVAAVVIGLVSRHHRDSALLVGLGCVSGYALMVTIKTIVGRTRPPEVDRLLQITTQSFPSGHAMMSTICYGLFGVAAWQVSAWVRSRRWVLIAVPVVVVAIGCSRIYLGVHWLTDVVAGWIFGSIWVVLCVFVWRLATRVS